MFGLGIWEIAAIALVALIVIRPKDLPVFMRSIGRLYHKALDLHRGLTRALEEPAEEMKRQMEAAKDETLQEEGSVAGPDNSLIGSSTRRESPFENEETMTAYSVAEGTGLDPSADEEPHPSEEREDLEP
jgi:sec-independent protein translocase protein TatB